ncbi:MAG TPA: M14 family zinc carboxypeptidase, partial [bacterium]
MKTITLTILMLSAFAFSQAPDMIVRVYAPSWQSLKLISEKSLDIAAAHAGEWYDIVADQKTLDRIKSSGLTYEITIYSIAAEKEKVRGQYHSYAEVTQLLRNMASTYPSICKMDSLPIRTYQGRWLYGVKISDEPNIEDPNEGGFLVDGAHHSREWATIETVLFFADSMLRAYGVVPEITNTINTTEIYCFPVINVDGFVYDYPGQLMWRKNREPFGGTTGTDCNRNYAGCCDNIQGDWGAVDEGQASHGPGDETFCGAYNNSGDETRALTLYMKSHTINAYMSYHSYSELLMWPWGWTATATPDAAIYSTIGNRMADMVNSQGGGTYGRGPIYTAIYPVSGSSIEWCYSWNHWVNGVSNLSYTTEVGTSFYQPVGDLDNIVRQNFKALKYLAHYTDSIVLMCEGIVPAPIVHAGDTVPASFAITWQPKNTADNHPTRWELVELSNPSVVLDSLESGTSCWILNGFTLSTSQSHSATHSLFSGNTSDMNSAMYTAHPYIVQTNDSVTFWCYYNMENNYDVAVVEVSENTTEWSNLDTMRFTGTQTTWTRKAFSLTNWIGKSIYIRFRAMSDGGTNNGGFYVDDIRPVCLFANVTSISSSITDTLYSFPSHAIGEFYFYVRGDNAMWDWGDFSGLKKVVVIAAGMPATPTVTKPLDFGRLPDLNPTLTFTSTDPDGDQIRYRVMWDTDPTFASPESSTTANYASGAVVDFNFPSNLANGSTYWWKVKCTDPSGSGYWTQYTISRSLTVDTSLPAATCSWYQTTAAQFGFNTFSATMVQGDSVILVPSGAVIVDTLFEEHFISASMPAGWTVVNGNGDAYLWTVGTSTDLGSYTPPDFGSYYAYYSDDDAGSGNISNNEELLSPKWYVGGITAGLEIVYGYGFQVYETGEKYRLKFRKKTGSGAWTAWADQRV